ncbi:MAG: DUF1992 domain-containing protein [Burkholderiaceae bacterium]
MISALNRLVESRIEQARDDGEFDNLPGAGKPLQLDDDSMVPEELRVVYRVLKNAGFVPPEVTRLNASSSLQAVLTLACDELSSHDDEDGRRLRRRLVAVTTALDKHGIDLSMVAGGDYYQAAVHKLTADSG